MEEGRRGRRAGAGAKAAGRGGRPTRGSWAAGREEGWRGGRQYAGVDGDARGDEGGVRSVSER